MTTTIIITTTDATGAGKFSHDHSIFRKLINFLL